LLIEHHGVTDVESDIHMSAGNGGTGDILQFENVTKTFGDIVAVDGISITIPRKTVFGLLGPNGAGKTTMLRMITGLMRPTRGKIILFGSLPPGEEEAQQNIGYMPQHLSIYPGLTVEENLLFFGRIYGVSGPALAKRLEEVLDIIELSKRRDTPVATLSGGMIRRTLLGTALIHKPRFLLLDEPTAGIDPLLRLKIWSILRRLCDEGTSILVTTHHISEADRCDRVVFLRDGRVISDGAPSALMEKYGATDLEASFVKAIEDKKEGRGG